MGTQREWFRRNCNWSAGLKQIGWTKTDFNSSAFGHVNDKKKRTQTFRFVEFGSWQRFQNGFLSRYRANQRRWFAALRCLGRDGQTESMTALTLAAVDRFDFDRFISSLRFVNLE